MKTYIIQRHNRHGASCSVLPEQGRIYPLPHLVRHSPDGFEYGYGGSGPSDLARSIVGDLLGEKDPKPSMYRPVVEGIISHLDGSGPFWVSEQEVLDKLPKIEQGSTGAIIP